MNDCIERMQDNLSTLRKSLGWSGADLGERLGISRQAISFYETGNYRMKMMHYLVICKLVEDEIREKIEWSGDEHELYMTQILMDCFIKDDEGWFDSDEDRNNVKTLIGYYSEAVFAKVRTRDEVHKEFKRTIENLGYGNLI